MSADSSDAPLAWILIGDKGGDNAQMRFLAAAAGLRVVEIPLKFNGRHRRSNLFLGASLRSLKRSARPLLQPPWPDIVLTSGRRSVPAARWIRKQSGGRTKLVHVGRPWGRLAWFDLVLAMPQYGLPSRPNVFQARMPFNAPSREVLDRAAARWRERFAEYPRPWIGLLVGGKSAPLRLEPPTAAAIGRTVAERARSLGGSVLALTSRRTGVEETEALFAALDAPGLRYAWQGGDADNPYFAVLALADELVVTADSASMLAEAVRTGHPLAIAPLPRRAGRRRQRTQIARRLMPRWLFALFVDLGFFTTTRDMHLLQQGLVSNGLASLLPAAPIRPNPAIADDLPIAAALVRKVAGSPFAAN